MKKTITLLSLLLQVFLGSPLLASNNPDHRLSSDEKADMPFYLRQVSQYGTLGITNPPFSPVRASAEWEQIDALVVTWTSYTNTIRQIINYAQSETRVLVICSDSNAVITNLNANQVPITNVDFIETGFNSIWSRDYGQWNVYTNSVDSLLLIDWIYNRPRIKDDTIPRAVASFTGLPLYETTTSPTDLIHTGGNFMCDGMGTGFSSRLILNENPTKTEPQIDSIMQSFMGINRYIKMDTLPYDQIHHIDMHMKLLDEETILVGEYPPGVADGPRIDSNIAYIQNNYLSPFGTPYKIVRIPMPPDAAGAYPNTGGAYRTYTNSVFVNKTIIVPTFDPQYDTTALRIYRENMPGYRVVGINCNQIITQLGAIHCITKEVAAADPLLIVHQPLRDQNTSASPYTVAASIEHRSGIASATLYFRTDTVSTYTAVPMTAGSGTSWTGLIPPQPNGTTVYYYIHAEANSGKQQNRPITAPSGYWKFKVYSTVGISEQPSSVDIAGISPNPANGWTEVSMNVKATTNVVVRLIDLSGKEISRPYEGGLTAGSQKIRLNVAGIAAGIYLLEIRNGSAATSRKLVIE